jgi:penicillin-binding protein 1C
MHRGDLSPRPTAGGIALSALLSLLIAAGVVAALRVATRPMEDISYSTAVYDRRGTLLRLTLSTDEKYRMRPDLGGVPRRFVEAVLLKEDRLFYWHCGINPAAIVRAAWHSLVLRDYRAGGSTVTMQVARLLFDLDTTRVAGKLLQMLDAVLIELTYPKARILETYFALVPCGGNVEGFPAASLLYLRKPLSALSLSEMLLLCGIPQRPQARDPGSEATNAREARDRLYREWLRIHPEDAGLSTQFALPHESPTVLPFAAPHAVASLLQRHPGAALIRSTIDLRMQTTVERIVRSYRDRNACLGIRNATALLVRADTTEILAEVGSVDFFDSGIDGQVNGTEARRSPGSTLKPFLYALAMDQSLIHPRTVLKDAPIHFSGYNPDNFDDDFVGPITASDALVKSRNVPAVTLMQRVKKPDLYEFLARGGVGGLRPRSDYGVSLILGTAEVTMKELAALYCVLATGGEYRPLRDTLDAPGERSPARLLSPQAAYLTARILQERPRQDELGAGPVAARPRPCAWKTGTSIGFRDAWCVGVFDSFILCVWVGNFDGSGNPEFVGLRTAAPLMFEIIDALRASGLEGVDGEASVVQPPPGIISIKVCGASGRIPTALCPVLVDTLFIPGVSPIDVCDVHQQINVDIRTGLRRSRPVPGRTRSVVAEIWPSDILILFDKAGLPRRPPPPYAPDEDINARAEPGTSPRISSPLAGGEYAVRVGDAMYGEIPFLAVVPADSATVYWFLDESYVGQSPGKSAFFWKARPGAYVLRATDEHGRSDSCSFSVVARQ